MSPFESEPPPRPWALIDDTIRSPQAPRGAHIEGAWFWQDHHRIVFPANSSMRNVRIMARPRWWQAIRWARAIRAWVGLTRLQDHGSESSEGSS